MCRCPVSGVVSVWLVVAVAWWCLVCPGVHRFRPRRGWSPSFPLVLFVLVRRVMEGGILRLLAAPLSASSSKMPTISAAAGMARLAMPGRKRGASATPERRQSLRAE